MIFIRGNTPLHSSPAPRSLTAATTIAIHSFHCCEGLPCQQKGGLLPSRFLPLLHLRRRGSGGILPAGGVVFTFGQTTSHVWWVDFLAPVVGGRRGDSAGKLSLNSLLSFSRGCPSRNMGLAVNGERQSHLFFQRQIRCWRQSPKVEPPDRRRPPIIVILFAGSTGRLETCLCIAHRAKRGV